MSKPNLLKKAITRSRRASVASHKPIKKNKKYIEIERQSTSKKIYPGRELPK